MKVYHCIIERYLFTIYSHLPPVFCLRRPPIHGENFCMLCPPIAILILCPHGWVWCWVGFMRVSMPTTVRIQTGCALIRTMDPTCNGEGMGSSSEPVQLLSNGPCNEHAPKLKEGYWWHVNKSGFPISEETWSKMWQHIEDVHPEASSISESIRGQSLKRVPIPPPPLVNPSYSAYHNLLSIQNALQYNHTGTQFFDVKKYRSLSR